MKTVLVEEKGGNEIAEAAEAKKWWRPQSDYALMRGNTVNQDKFSLSIVSSCWTLLVIINSCKVNIKEKI